MVREAAKEQEQLTEALSGEDAERLVAYIENPNAPKGHNDYLRQADQVFSETQAREAAKH